jgi:hypothetical protein
MKTARFRAAQVMGILEQAEADAPVGAELLVCCRFSYLCSKQPRALGKSPKCLN